MQSKEAIFSLSWQSIAYGIGVIGSQLVIYLAIPIFTTYMSKTEYGVIAVSLAFLSLIDMLSNAGLPAATFRLYNDSPDIEIQKQIIGSSLFLFLFFAIIIALIVWLISNQLSEWLLDNVAYAGIIRLVAVVVVFSSLVYYGVILLRINVKPIANSVQSLIQISTQIGLALFFVLILNYGVLGYWLGQLGGVIIGFLVMVWLVRKYLVFNVSRERLSSMMLYALPLLPAALSMWALRLVDRGMIASILGVEEVAVYEVGYKIGMLAALLIVPFQAAWPQFAFTIMHRSEAAKVYRDVLTYITFGCTFIALFLIIFGADLLALMAPMSYAMAISVIPWVAIAMIAFGMYPILSIGPKIMKKTGLIAWVAIIAAIINVGLNYILLPIWGITGAAIATLIAYTFLSIATFMFGKRLYTFPIDWSRLFKIFVSAFLSIFLAFQIVRLDLVAWQTLFLKAISLLTFPILLIALGFVSQDQLKDIFRWMKGLLSKYIGRELKDADKFAQ